MNMKKLLALLLALVMVFSLAACAGGDKDDDDKDEKEETTESAAPQEEDKGEETKPADTKPAAASVSPDDLVDALEDLMKNPSIKTLCGFMGGTLLGDEVKDLMTASLTMMGTTEDDLVASFAGEMEGASLKSSDSEELSADDLKAAQDKADASVEAWKATAESMQSELDAATDEDWESFADSLGVSVDEAKVVLQDMVDALFGLADALDGAEISEGYRVTIETETDGETSSETLCMYVVDGKWFTEGVFELDF